MKACSAQTPALPEEVLSPLCAPFAKQADWILSLYEMTRGSIQHPGRCVNCFYELLGAAQGEKRRALEPLKRWIEENLQIAIQAGEREAGLLPVLLEEPDLESFCLTAMRRVREDAVILEEEIALSFRFKGAA